MSIFFTHISPDATFSLYYLSMNIPLIGLFTLVEICTITVLTKNVTISPRILCISQSKVVKAIQVYAICNILWFAHRVGNCFIVSIYFIAIAPSQTIAVVTLCLSAIILFIIAIAVQLIFVTQQIYTRNV